MSAPYLAAEDAAGSKRNGASIVVATLFGVIGVFVFSVQPGYLQALVDRSGLTGAQAGYIAAAEMAGYAGTMIFISFVSHRLPWRPLLVICALLNAGGNAACLLDSHTAWLSAARLVAGLGSGGFMSLAFSAVGMSQTPDRHFGFMGMWMLGYGAAALFVLPSLLTAVGLPGFYTIVAAVALASLALVPFMPAGFGGSDEANGGVAGISGTGRVLAVLSMSLFFGGCGMLWAYLSLIGTRAGVGTRAVDNALVLSQFAGIAGSLIVGVIGARFGRFKPLGLAILVSAGSAFALNHVRGDTALLFAAAVCLFNGAWNLAQPVYLSAATGFDPRGRLVSQMAAASACGLAAGPFVGATLGGELHSRMLVWVVALTFLAAILLIALPFLESSRRSTRISNALVG